MKHYIAMAGLHGYLPNYCDVYPDYKSACDGLAQIHELGKGRTAQLKRDGYLELRKSDGNEYCEITDCECDEPWIHSDSMTEKEFIAEYGEQFGITEEE